MPYVFVHTSKERAKLLAPEFGEDGSISRQLRLAIAKTLGDLEQGAKDVEVHLIADEAQDNATRVAILVDINWTTVRLEHWGNTLPILQKMIASAWKFGCRDKPDLRREFPLNKVGIKPYLSYGTWRLASDLIPNW